MLFKLTIFVDKYSSFNKFVENLTAKNKVIQRIIVSYRRKPDLGIITFWCTSKFSVFPFPAF